MSLNFATRDNFLKNSIINNRLINNVFEIDYGFDNSNTPLISFLNKSELKNNLTGLFNIDSVENLNNIFKNNTLFIELPNQIMKYEQTYSSYGKRQQFNKREDDVLSIGFIENESFSFMRLFDNYFKTIIQGKYSLYPNEYRMGKLTIKKNDNDDYLIYKNVVPFSSSNLKLDIMGDGKKVEIIEVKFEYSGK